MSARRGNERTHIMAKTAQHSRTEISPTEARQAQPMGRVRYILGISIGLTVIGFIAAWVFGVF